jgi:hypothetical protein
VCIGLSAWLLAVHTQAPADSTVLAPLAKPATRQAEALSLAGRPPAAFARSRRAPAPAIGSGRTLTWPGVPGATFYDVILSRDGKRVLDLWPATPRVTLPKHWTFGGKRFALAAGGYRWFVYPATGTRADARYGSLSAHGLFTL